MSGGLARAEVEANSIYPNWQRVASGVTAQCPSITTALWKHKYSPHMQAEVWLGGLSRVQWIDRRDCVCVCKCMGSPSLQLLTADKVPTVQWIHDPSLDQVHWHSHSIECCWWEEDTVD